MASLLEAKLSEVLNQSTNTKLLRIFAPFLEIENHETTNCLKFS